MHSKQKIRWEAENLQVFCFGSTQRTWQYQSSPQNHATSGCWDTFSNPLCIHCRYPFHSTWLFKCFRITVYFAAENWWVFYLNFLLVITDTLCVELIFRCSDRACSSTQCADGESNKIVYDKKKTVTEWTFNTYWIRNYFVPNPVNSKLIRLKKNFKKLKSKN